MTTTGAHIPSLLKNATFPKKLNLESPLKQVRMNSENTLSGTKRARPSGDNPSLGNRKHVYIKIDHSLLKDLDENSGCFSIDIPSSQIMRVSALSKMKAADTLDVDKEWVIQERPPTSLTSCIAKIENQYLERLENNEKRLDEFGKTIGRLIKKDVESNLKIQKLEEGVSLLLKENEDLAKKLGDISTTKQSDAVIDAVFNWMTVGSKEFEKLRKQNK